jgi:hypothetical protein
VSVTEVASLPAIPTELFAEPTVFVRPWVDDVIDTLGFDPRSSYVESYWLTTLGPSATWLLRRIAAGFDREPAGFELPLSETATQLGLGHKGGRHSPFVRAFWRICQFDLGRAEGPGLEVRRRLPPLTRRQVQRLPDGLREQHEAWQLAQLGAKATAATRRRAQALALTLLEINPDASAVEQRLTSWSLHPAVAREAAGWAWERHTAALRAATESGGQAEIA